jgi:hypothetical protein
MDTGRSFLGVKSSRGVTLATPVLAKSRLSTMYTSSPPHRLHADSEIALLFYFDIHSSGFNQLTSKQLVQFKIHLLVTFRKGHWPYRPINRPIKQEEKINHHPFGNFIHVTMYFLRRFS